MPQMNIDTSSWDLFDLFKPLAALYFIVIAISGKGKLLENEHPKCAPEKYRLHMRLLCAAAGLILGVTGVTELFLAIDRYSLLGWIFWALGLISIVAVAGYNILMTDRKAQREAMEAEAAKRGGSSGSSGRASGRPAGGTRMPDAAFNFDSRDDAPATATDEHRSDAG